MTVKELKCPNCSAPIPPGTLKCQYCGSYLVVQNNALSLQSMTTCPECQAPIGGGSFICINCGKLLTNDSKELNIAKTMQKRIRFLQNRWINLLFQVVRERLEPEEYIFHVSGAKGGFLRGKDRQNVVTNKRIIRYHGGKFYVIQYDNIVTISDPIADFVGDMAFYTVVVTTYQGDVSFLFSDLSTADGFSRTSSLAHDNLTFKKKDIMAFLCFADI